MFRWLVQLALALLALPAQVLGFILTATGLAPAPVHDDPPPAASSDWEDDFSAVMEWAALKLDDKPCEPGGLYAPWLRGLDREAAESIAQAQEDGLLVAHLWSLYCVPDLPPASYDTPETAAWIRNYRSIVSGGAARQPERRQQPAPETAPVDDEPEPDPASRP